MIQIHALLEGTRCLRQQVRSKCRFEKKLNATRKRFETVVSDIDGCDTHLIQVQAYRKRLVRKGQETQGVSRGTEILTFCIDDLQEGSACGEGE